MYLRIVPVIALLGSLSTAHAQEAGLGLFEKRTDVGKVAHAGTVALRQVSSYLHHRRQRREHVVRRPTPAAFVWKRMVRRSGTLSGHSVSLGKGKNAHRKACLMIRQDLDADAAYVDVAVHGDGLTSLQFRDREGQYP